MHGGVENLGVGQRHLRRGVRQPVLDGGEAHPVVDELDSFGMPERVGPEAENRAVRPADLAGDGQPIERPPHVAVADGAATPEAARAPRAGRRREQIPLGVVVGRHRALDQSTLRLHNGGDLGGDRHLVAEHLGLLDVAAQPPPPLGRLQAGIVAQIEHIGDAPARGAQQDDHRDVLGAQSMEMLVELLHHRRGDELDRSARAIPRRDGRMFGPDDLAERACRREGMLDALQVVEELREAPEVAVDLGGGALTAVAVRGLAEVAEVGLDIGRLEALEILGARSIGREEGQEGARREQGERAGRARPAGQEERADELFDRGTVGAGDARETEEMLTVVVGVAGARDVAHVPDVPGEFDLGVGDDGEVERGRAINGHAMRRHVFAPP